MSFPGFAVPLPLLILLALAAGVNLLGFASMGWDKRCAKRGRRRVPERTLFAIAFLGGAAGSLAGMYYFRHKTRHLSFVVGIPAILILHCAVLGWALWRFL